MIYEETIASGRRFAAGLTALWLCAVAPLLAQTPPPAFDIEVSPPDGSILITETTNTVFVTINNLNLFTNVAVQGTFDGQLIPFPDNGQAPDQNAGDGTFSADLIAPLVTVSTTNILKLVITGELPPPDPPPNPPD